MNTRLTLVLVLTATALAVGVLLTQTREETPAPTDPTHRVMSFDPDEVVSLELENRQGDRVVVRKDDSKWRIISPVESPGDDNQVEAFVGRVGNLVAKDAFEPEEPLLEYGLDPPILTVSVGMSDGVRHRLRVGSRTVDRRSTYGATYGRTEVFLIPNLIVDEAMRMINEPAYLAPAATETP